jgi:hypothetical protein
MMIGNVHTLLRQDHSTLGRVISLINHTGMSVLPSLSVILTMFIRDFDHESRQGLGFKGGIE